MRWVGLVCFGLLIQGAVINDYLGRNKEPVLAALVTLVALLWGGALWRS